MKDHMDEVSALTLSAARDEGYKKSRHVGTDGCFSTVF